MELMHFFIFSKKEDYGKQGNIIIVGPLALQNTQPLMWGPYSCAMEKRKKAIKKRQKINLKIEAKRNRKSKILLI